MGESAVRTSCTVVVPTRNRPASLGRCLAGLAGQDHPAGSFEVLVVDDGGDVSLDRIVAAASERLRVRLLRKANGGPALARNHGVRHANGQLIAFTDDDCEPEPGWLRAFAEAHTTSPDAMLGGHTVNALPSNPFATTSQLLIDYLYGYYNSPPNGARFFTSNNMAVDRDRFLESGGFDPLFRTAAGEDRDLSARWRHMGWPLVFTPEARVSHAHPLTLRTFVRQHLGYGRAAYYFRAREARRSDRGVRLEPARFYTDMVRLPFERTGAREGARLAALLMLSQAGNAAGYFWEKMVSDHRGNGNGGAEPVAADDEPVASGDEPVASDDEPAASDDEPIGAGVSEASP